MKPQRISSAVDQQQTCEKDREEGESVRLWAESSVWSLVCAMELGLIPEPSTNSVSLDDRAPVRRNALMSEELFTINPSIVGSSGTAARKPPLGFAAKRCSQKPAKQVRKGPGKRAIADRKVYASCKSRDIDRGRNPTVQSFWKSCKRKLAGRSKKKREYGNCEDLDFSETTRNLFSDQPRNIFPSEASAVAKTELPSLEKENSAVASESYFDVGSRPTFVQAASLEQTLCRRNRSGKRAGNSCVRRNNRRSSGKSVKNAKARSSKILKLCNGVPDRKQTSLDWQYRDRDHVSADTTTTDVDNGRFRSSTNNRQRTIALLTATVQANTTAVVENSATSRSLADEPLSGWHFDRVRSPSIDDRSNDCSNDRSEIDKGCESNEHHVGEYICGSSETRTVSPLPHFQEDDSEGKGSSSTVVNDAPNKSHSEKTAKNCSKRQGLAGKKGKVTSNGIGINEPGRDNAKSDTLRRKIHGLEEEYHDIRRVTRGLTKISKENFVGKLVWGSCSGWWPALIIDADHVGMLSEAGKLWVYWIGEARISLLNEKTHIESFSCNLKHRLTQNLNVARIRAIDATMQMLRTRLGCSLTKPYSTWIENNFANMIEFLDEIKFFPYPARIQQRLDFLKEKNAKVTEKYLLDQKRENQSKKVADKLKDFPQQQNDADLTRLPLKEQYPGVIAWAKIAGHNWWPAMIIDYRDCCMREPSFGCQWIMWYGDYKLSEVHHQLFLRFDKGIDKLRDYINNTKKHVYLMGVLRASKDYCSLLGCETDNWTLMDVFKYFSDTYRLLAASNPPPRRSDSAKIYDKYSAHIVEKLNELKNDANIDDKRANDIKNSEDLHCVTSGKVALESLCLKCLKILASETEAHPFFEGSLCKDCSEQYKPCMFVFGNDNKCFYCTVCAASGTVIICDKEDCPRVYCTACMKHLLCPTTYDQVLQEDPWECFLCKNDVTAPFSDTILRPRPNWKDKIIDMFRTKCNSNVRAIEQCDYKRRIRVLSLFDGLSTGLLVLLKLGLVVDVYYASEIDQDALMVSASHFGDRIIHLGDVKEITKEKMKEIAPIDLLIGGSPCNDLSLANPARLGLYDPKGTGVLFFEYCRIMKLLKKHNSGRHLFWMYENVASMPSEYRLAINKHLGQEPDVIDSADFSPQHRLRLYWHNLPIEPHSLSSQSEQDVQDILTPHCQRYALVKKIRTVTTKVNSLKQGKLALKPILMKDESDSLWITELEEIFGFPRHYTDVKNLSATKRQRLIGKSWSVQTLAAILGSLCPFFECNTIDKTVESHR